jgi:hypothetical protein
MRKLLLVAATLIPATLLLAQSQVKPLDIKPGSWDVTMNTSINGMGATQSHTYRTCVKKEDLSNYPFTDPDANCNYKVVTSTGTKMDAHGTCTPKSGDATIDFELHLSVVDSGSVNGNGTLNMKFSGGAMNGKYTATAKWLSDTCTK